MLIDTGSSGTGWSYYGTFLRCPQLFAWSYKDGPGVPDGPATAAPLRRGSILHGGLGHHYGVQLGLDVYPWPEAMELIADKFESEPEERADLKAIIEAYIDHWKYETLEPLAVEKLIKLRIDDILYTMRIDLVVREKGKIFFTDHKSTSKISDKKFFTRYILSGAFQGHILAGRKLYGSEFGGVIINGLPSSSKDLRFVRQPLPPTPGLTEKVFRETLRHAVRGMKQLEGTPINQYPRAMHEQTCLTSYGVCEFFERCQWGR